MPEKPPNLTVQQPEGEPPETHNLNLKEIFDESKQASSHYPSAVVGGRTVAWVENIIRDNGYRIYPDHRKPPSYFVAEIARNATEAAESGEVSVRIADGVLHVSVIDAGPGFKKDPREIVEGQKRHGLNQVVGYADEFTLETNGAQYQKIEGKLQKTGDSDIKVGTKVTFSKKLLPRKRRGIKPASQESGG